RFQIKPALTAGEGHIQQVVAEGRQVRERSDLIRVEAATPPEDHGVRQEVHQFSPTLVFFATGFELGVGVHAGQNCDGIQLRLTKIMREVDFAVPLGVFLVSFFTVCPSSWDPGVLP
ncbi:hypothetical protein ILP92_18055, partial [Maribius pontilimi]